MDILDKADERKRKLLEITQDMVGKDRTGFGDDPKLLKDVIPINIPNVDDILGGGFRKGRVAMIVGQESMGKTLFTQWIIKSFQEQGEICGFVDPEKTFDAKWFEITGVNVRDLVVVHPESTEQTFDLACEWSRNGMGLIVVDSLAALTPKARREADLEDQEFMGLASRKTSEGLNLFTNMNNDALLVCTNQLRSKIGVIYGSPDEIPGGRAQRHYASYIIKISRKGWIEETVAGKKERMGYNMLVHTLKNKLHTPLQDAIVPFMYSGVIDTVGGAIDLAVDMGILKGARGRYEWEEHKFHGKRKVSDFFYDNPDEFEKLQELIKYGTGEVEFD